MNYMLLVLATMPLTTFAAQKTHVRKISDEQWLIIDSAFDTPQQKQQKVEIEQKQTVQEEPRSLPTVKIEQEQQVQQEELSAEESIETLYKQLEPRVFLVDHFWQLRKLNHYWKSTSERITYEISVRHTIAMIKEIICLGYPLSTVEDYLLLEQPEAIKKMLDEIRQELQTIPTPHNQRLQIVRYSVDALEDNIIAAQQRDKNEKLRIIFCETIKDYRYSKENVEKILKLMADGAEVEDNILAKAYPEKLIAFIADILKQQDLSESIKTAADTLQQRLCAVLEIKKAAETNASQAPHQTTAQLLSDPKVPFMAKLSVIYSGDWGD